MHQKCAGVRFSVGNLVDFVYRAASRNCQKVVENWAHSDVSKSLLDAQGTQYLRASLGHPLGMMQPKIRCIVSGAQGLDFASCNDRYLVAARLWREGM